jgi:chaperonin GroES
MIEAINGNVVLKRIEEEEQTYGQIVIPDMGKEKPELAKVIKTSDTYNWHTGKFVDSLLSVGDMVVIPKMGSMNVSFDGQDYIIVKETDVLAIIKK